MYKHTLYSGSLVTPGHVLSVGVPTSLNKTVKSLKPVRNNYIILINKKILENSFQLLINITTRKQWTTGISKF